MSPTGRPLRFMALMLGLWVAGRTLWLWPAGAVAEDALPPEPVLVAEADTPVMASYPDPDFLPGQSRATPPRVRSSVAQRPNRVASAPDRIALADTGEAMPAAPGGIAGIALMGLGVLGFAQTPSAPAQSRPIAGSPQPPPRGTNRLSASAWLFGRSAMAPAPLASGGQLGGSQFGARLVYRVAGSPQQPLSAFARLSGPLSQRGRELALGVEAQPFARVPVRLAVERRIALEEGAASGVAVSAIGGGSVALPHGLRLDAYGQAGVVGLKRRDLFVDGAAVVTRQVAEVRSIPVRVGAGLWGGAQPGVSRLDVGPRVEAGLPMAGQTVRLGLDWREKVAGNATPGSGPAVTLGADF